MCLNVICIYFSVHVFWPFSPLWAWSFLCWFGWDSLYIKKISSSLGYMFVTIFSRWLICLLTLFIVLWWSHLKFLGITIYQKILVYFLLYFILRKVFSTLRLFFKIFYLLQVAEFYRFFFSFKFLIHLELVLMKGVHCSPIQYFPGGSPIAPALFIE